MRAKNPWLAAFLEERDLPSGVTGPRDLAPFWRDARERRSAGVRVGSGVSFEFFSSWFVMVAASGFSGALGACRMGVERGGGVGVKCFGMRGLQILFASCD